MPGIRAGLVEKLDDDERGERPVRQPDEYVPDADGYFLISDFTTARVLVSKYTSAFLPSLSKP